MKERIIKSRLVKRIFDRVFGAVVKNDPKSYNVPGDGTYSFQGKRTMAYYGGLVVEKGLKLFGVWFVTQAQLLTCL